ncbi:LysR substrate-binding domain-containing protein [soil metagenome]
MPEPFVVAFVVGVTPGKWARAWGERMPAHPLTLSRVSPSDALAAVRDGSADVALLRLPIEHEDLSVIPLYEESPFVVVPRDHVIEALDGVTIAELDGENVLAGDWASAIELVAANVGVAVMPQSVARALSRRDVVARPVTDAPATRIALAWLTSATTPEVDEFVGIVRGRTANSSRGQRPEPEPTTEKKLEKANKPPAKKDGARRPLSARQPRRKSGRGR